MSRRKVPETVDPFEQLATAIAQRLSRNSERDQAVAAFDDLAATCEAAIRVWQDYLDAPGGPGDSWTLLSWIGPARAKRLHEINLEAKSHLMRLATFAGPPLSRLIGLDADVIEMGYRQLRPGETGPDAARAAMARMQDRIAQVQVWKERVRIAMPRRQTQPLKRAGTHARPVKSGAVRRPARPAKTADKKPRAAKKKK